MVRKKRRKRKKIRRKKEGEKKKFKKPDHYSCFGILRKKLMVQNKRDVLKPCYLRVVTKRNMRWERYERGERFVHHQIQTFILLVMMFLMRMKFFLVNKLSIKADHSFNSESASQIH
jgi:hypothetical protein